VHKNRRHGCQGSGQILKSWLYKVVDKEVRMHTLENLGGELIKVEDGLVSCEHNECEGTFLSWYGDEGLEE